MSGTDPNPPKRSRLRRIAIDLAVVLLVLAGIGAWQTRDLVSTGTPAPGFELVDLQGATHRLDELKGRKVLLYFWAPWCGVCKAAAPNVASIAKSQDAEVLSIALSYKSEADVERVAREHGIPGPVLLGDSGVRESYAVSAYPTFYVIGADGTIRHTLVGYATWLGLKTRLLWTAIVAS